VRTPWLNANPATDRLITGHHGRNPRAIFARLLKPGYHAENSTTT
jgi:hypothetical protein